MHHTHHTHQTLAHTLNSLLIISLIRIKIKKKVICQFLAFFESYKMVLWVCLYRCTERIGRFNKLILFYEILFTHFIKNHTHTLATIVFEVLIMLLCIKNHTHTHSHTFTHTQRQRVFKIPSQDATIISLLIIEIERKIIYQILAFFVSYKMVLLIFINFDVKQRYRNQKYLLSLYFYLNFLYLILSICNIIFLFQFTLQFPVSILSIDLCKLTEMIIINNLISFLRQHQFTSQNSIIIYDLNDYISPELDYWSNKKLSGNRQLGKVFQPLQRLKFFVSLLAFSYNKLSQFQHFSFDMQHTSHTSTQSFLLFLLLLLIALLLCQISLLLLIYNNKINSYLKHVLCFLRSNFLNTLTTVSTNSHSLNIQLTSTLKSSMFLDTHIQKYTSKLTSFHLLSSKQYNNKHHNVQ
jgi:hypothetical protein